jgi:phage FluMu protein Com
MINSDYLIRKNGKYSGDIKCPICEEIIEWKENENAEVRVVLKDCAIEEHMISGLNIGRNYIIPAKISKTGEVTFKVYVVAECPKCNHKIEFYERAKYTR